MPSVPIFDPGGSVYAISNEISQPQGFLLDSGNFLMHATPHTTQVTNFSTITNQAGRTIDGSYLAKALFPILS